MNKYTPRPLQAVRTNAGLVIIEQRETLGVPIAQIYSSFPDVENAYAHLFVTAPTLLIALEWLVRIHNDDCPQDECDDAFEFAKEAITKVKS